MLRRLLCRWLGHDPHYEDSFDLIRWDGTRIRMRQRSWFGCARCHKRYWFFDERFWFIEETREAHG